ncbi:MAG: carboxymuconolactone decarboxylase family protein [Desulfarculus sp.]|nr:carboxymuconolactone decarboxylase family protein [Desulfarculus sp.]
MSEHQKLPKHYRRLREDFPAYMEALDRLGEAVGQQGPLDAKTLQLLQLAGAVATRSEGAAHSHARRALEAGATPTEIRHAVIALTSTVGFPTIAAGLSWVEDILKD